MVIIDIVMNTLLGTVIRHPAGMHCPSWDDAFVSSCMWQSLSDILQEAITLHIPQKTVTSIRKKPLWMTGQVLRSVKKKHKLWK